MSNGRHFRRRLDLSSTLDDLFSQSEDEPIPGGCDRCSAYQTFTSPAPGVHLVNVHHDDWCPFIRSREAGSN